MVIETENAIFNKGFPRCRQPIGMPKVWKNCPPPPNSTDQQLKEWNIFMSEYCEDARKY
jgi:hypothetical protein